jgi:RES domain-containing protein
MLTTWRITHRSLAKTAFDGEGARMYGGRWNSFGTPVVYTAQSQALAVLEMLVHLDSPEPLKGYVFFEVRFDASLVKELAKSQLPRNWKSDPVPRRAQAVGDAWVRSGESAVLAVPSVIVPGERNYLLNPRHPDFQRLKIGKPQPYELDARLAKHR